MKITLPLSTALKLEQQAKQQGIPAQVLAEQVLSKFLSNSVEGDRKATSCRISKI